MSGEPEAQRLSPVSGGPRPDPHPDQSDLQPSHLSSSLVGMALLPPEHLTPVLILWAEATLAVMQGPREEGTGHRGHKSAVLGRARWAIPEALEPPPTSGSPEPTEKSYHRLRCRLVMGAVWGC